MPPNNKKMVAWDLHPVQWRHQVNEPQNMLCAHKRTIIYEKVTFKNERPSLYRDLKIFFQSVINDSRDLTI